VHRRSTLAQKGGQGPSSGAPVLHPLAALKPMLPLPLREQQMSAAGSEGRAPQGARQPARRPPAGTSWAQRVPGMLLPSRGRQRSWRHTKGTKGIVTWEQGRMCPLRCGRWRRCLSWGDGTELLLELAGHAVADSALATSALLPPVSTMGALGHKKVTARAAPDLAARPAVKEAELGEGEKGKEPQRPFGAEAALK